MRPLARYRFGLLAALSLAPLLLGCPQQAKTLANDNRDIILPLAFTPSTVAAVGEVPMYHIDSALSFGGLAVGEDPGSKLLGAVLGAGTERQVLLNIPNDLRNNFYHMTVIHEYVHQADYEGLLDRDLFRDRIIEMLQDPEYAGVSASFIDFLGVLTDDPLQGIALLYDRGILREGMAYLIESWVDGCIELPPYVLEVYAGVIDELSPYRDDGNLYCFITDTKSASHAYCRSMLSAQ